MWPRKVLEAKLAARLAPSPRSELCGVSVNFSPSSSFSPSASSTHDGHFAFSGVCRQHGLIWNESGPKETRWERIPRVRAEFPIHTLHLQQCPSVSCICVLASASFSAKVELESLPFSAHHSAAWATPPCRRHSWLDCLNRAAQDLPDTIAAHAANALGTCESVLEQPRASAVGTENLKRLCFTS